jgi:hypothetical protein
MRDIIKEAEKLIKRDYPNLEINVARDGGDVVEFLLYDSENLRLGDSIVASYNMWYPSEILYFKLVLL